MTAAKPVTDRLADALNCPLAGRAATAVMVAIGAALLVMPQLKYLAMRTYVFDLGQYANFAFNVVHGDGPTYALRTHANLYLLPYGAVYALFPNPACLLLIQSLVLIAAGWAYLVLWRQNCNVWTPWFGLLCALSVSVWYNDLFDFHFEHLLFLLVPLFAIVAGRKAMPGRFLILAALALAICAVKEVYALTAAVLALFMLGRRNLRQGIAIAVLCVSYFAVMTGWVIPYFTDGRAIGTIWNLAFGYLGQTPTEMARTLAANPLMALDEITGPGPKLTYAAALFGSLAFVPLLAPMAAAPALPSLLMSLLSHNPNHVLLVHQYTAGVTPALLCAFAAAVTRPGRRPAFAAGALTAALLASLALMVLRGPSPLSRPFWSDWSWSYQSAAYLPSPRDAWIRRMINTHVPANPEIAVASQNDLVTTRLTNRRHLFAFPEGVFEPSLQPGWTAAAAAGGTDYGRSDVGILVDFVVLDLHRPWFKNDKGCDWYGGRCRSEGSAEGIEAMMAQVRDRWLVVFETDGLVILRRPKDRDGTEISP